MYRRTRLADFEQGDYSIATFQLNDVKQADISHPSCSASAKLGPTQSDYSDFPDLSDSELGDNNKVKFRDLLKTSLVQHVIDAGDASPIKKKASFSKKNRSVRNSYSV